MQRFCAAPTTGAAVATSRGSRATLRVECPGRGWYVSLPHRRTEQKKPRVLHRVRCCRPGRWGPRRGQVLEAADIKVRVQAESQLLQPLAPARTATEKRGPPGQNPRRRKRSAAVRSRVLVAEPLPPTGCTNRRALEVIRNQRDLLGDVDRAAAVRAAQSGARGVRQAGPIRLVAPLGSASADLESGARRQGSGLVILEGGHGSHHKVAR